MEKLRKCILYRVFLYIYSVAPIYRGIAGP